MTIDPSFDELHRLLRGSRCAVNLVNARALFDTGEFAESICNLQRIREEYQSSRKSTLAVDSQRPSSSDKEELLARKRHEKTIDALQLMDGLISSIQLVASRDTSNKTPQSDVDTTPIAVDSTINTKQSNESQLRSKLANAKAEANVKQILLENFRLEIINPNHSFSSGERMVIFANGDGTVVQVEDPPLVNQSLRIINWQDGKRLVPIAIDKLIRASLKSKAFLLALPMIRPSVERIIETNKPEIVSDTADRDKILDMGAFTQLLDSAQRSGIVPGSGIIIQVRDCEYRLGRYNKALQMMETLYTSFVGAEMQRNQRLQIEENEIASGRKKMTQRDLQAKRIRDNQNTQAIERAKVRFQRVLEGLRGLLHLESHVDL